MVQTIGFFIFSMLHWFVADYFFVADCAKKGEVKLFMRDQYIKCSVVKNKNKSSK